jgi:NAD(P)-dependent dehydrogenase (short-subunit alcohol dehydrogenase family)
MQQSTITLITGVGREQGLGYETARQLAQQGDHVIVTARTPGQAEQLAQQLRTEGLPASALQLDVRDEHSVARLVTQVEQQFGRLDVLINNAAVMDLNEPLPMDVASAGQQFDTNVLGPWRVANSLLPLLRRSAQPRIVNVSSGMGAFSDPAFGLQSTLPRISTYALTKLALNGLTIKLARDFAPDRILVNAVCPDFTATYPGFAEQGARPVADGARSIVWAATLPADGPSGGFFRDGQALGW